MSRNAVFLGITFVLMKLSAGLEAATTISLQNGTAGFTGTIDTFVASTATANGGDPARNYGGAGALAVSPTTAAQGEFQSLLRFDLSSVKTQLDATYGVGGWSVSSVSLKLMPQAPGNAIFNGLADGNLNISWVSSDTWTEGTGTPALNTSDGLTYNGLASLLFSGTQLLGTYACTASSVGTLQTINFSTLSAGLLNDITTGGLATFDLATAAGSSGSAVFNSKSFGTVANRPALTIVANAVPEPGQVGLFGIGLFGLLGRRRQMRA